MADYYWFITYLLGLFFGFMIGKRHWMEEGRKKVLREQAIMAEIREMAERQHAQLAKWRQEQSNQRRQNETEPEN